MRIILPDVSRLDIIATIREARFPGHDPARWAIPLIDAMQDHVCGWQLAELDATTVDALWLAPHAGEPCHGDTMALGESWQGCTVGDGVSWLTRHAARYALANPSCWQRIAAARAAQPSAIVLAPFSVGDRLKPDDAAWVVVDGLHRALAWGLEGRSVLQAFVPTGTSGSRTS